MMKRVKKLVRAGVFAAVVICVSLAAVPVSTASVQRSVAARGDVGGSLDEDLSSPTLEAAVQRVVNMITSELVDGFRGEVRLRGERPAANAAAGEFQALLDMHFEAQFDDFIRLTERARTLTFEFDVTVSGRFVNIKFFCNRTAAATEQHILTTVIDSVSLEILTLTDVVGVNGAELINQPLWAQIASNPSRFSTSFSGITNSHGFFMDGTSAVLVFSEFELVNARVGITQVSIDTENVFNVTAEYEYIKESRGIKMIRLRHIADGFGYNLTWTSAARTVNISSAYGMNVTVSIDRNRYVDENHPGILELEAAPVIFNDFTYLPLSFFTQIMRLAYYVHQDGSITFSRFDSGVVIL